MVEIISLSLFGLSLIGMGVIIFRKMPALLELPEETLPSETVFKTLFSKIKNLNVFKEFSFELFLQKILSKIRVLTLKTDSKTSNWLQRLREKALRKKNSENDNYWQEIKGSTDSKNKPPA